MANKHSIMTREMVESFCNSYYIPDEVHSFHPGRDRTITQFPEGKVGVYTRLFDYCGYRIPLTKFFVAVLKHFRIHISQLSSFGAARVSHFEVLTRRSLSAPSCLSKPPDSIKNWAGPLFWLISKDMGLLDYIRTADVKAVVGETSLSFALLNVHTRAEGAIEALRRVSNLLGGASTSATPLSVEDLDTDEDLGSVLLHVLDDSRWQAKDCFALFETCSQPGWCLLVLKNIPSCIPKGVRDDSWTPFISVVPGEYIQVLLSKGTYTWLKRETGLGRRSFAILRNDSYCLYVTVSPPSTGNFNIPCAVDGTARIFLIPGLPIIALCWDGDLIIMKFIHAEVECTSSPILTSKAIWPSGQMVSPLNPIR
ncbi:hypothetical protein Tco_0755763 [Tanacetum coccineum]